MLLVSEKINEEGNGWICEECHRSLLANHLPKFALANNMWIGPVSFALRILSFVESLLIA